MTARLLPHDGPAHTFVERAYPSEGLTVADRKPTWHLTISPVIAGLLTLVWLVRVWRGENPIDVIVLLALAIITLFLTAVTAGVIAKRRKTP